MPDTAPIRWGILGPGNIAHRFAEGAKHLPDAAIVAVASRDRTRAEAFGDRWDVPRRYDDYQALADDPEVDAVYVATTHPFHRSCALLAIDAGKAVLCEKPFSVNAAEAEEMIGAARRKGVFLMEGMWSRYFPAMQRVRELVSGGAIGAIRLVQADFGFRSGYDPASRLWAPEQAGGSLLDVGCYTISFASMLLGEPEQVTGLATLAPNGVDEQASMVFRYRSGALAALTCAIRASTPQTATIVGDEGCIRIGSPWWRPAGFTLEAGGKTEPTEIGFESTGFNYEIAHANRCIRDGLTESPILPLDETLSILRTMDTLRSRWGVRYPME
jgi:predicted dehydrogenase